MKIDRNKINLAMARQKMNQTDLANRSGLKRQAVSVILTRGTCTTVNAGRLAEALGVDIREIVKEED